MKKLSYLLLLGLLYSASACKEDKIMLYNDVNYIQFTRYLVDSMTCSFLAYPDENEISFPLALEVIGFPSTREREYKISVVREYTDAPGDNYLLPGRFVMPAGKVIDTCYLTIRRTPRISLQAVRLAIRLEENEFFKVGQANKAGAIIYISDIIAKPEWWTSTVTDIYLGSYSDEKYRLFIRVTGIAEFDSSNVAELRGYTLMLKNYLLQEKDAGRTVLEKDNTEMTLPYYGI